GAKQAWLIAEDHVDAIFKTMDEESQAPIALISMSDVNTATNIYYYEKTFTFYIFSSFHAKYYSLRSGNRLLVLYKCNDASKQ
ncbi:MAG: hypothetical protein ACPG4E_02900, partial [Flavobacteriaceae bacterium]